MPQLAKINAAFKICNIHNIGLLNTLPQDTTEKYGFATSSVSTD